MTNGTSALLVERQSAYRFGNLRLTSDGFLYRGQTSIHLPPRELAVLRYLLANAGSLVSPAQLKQAVWKDLHVTDESVPRCVSSLRARLLPEECIHTEYKRGYRINGDVWAVNGNQTSVPARLAILPFSAGTQVPAYLGRAVAEEMLAQLGREANGGLTLLARDSAFTLAENGMAAQKVGEALHADLVMAGSLRAFPTQLRLRAEMIRVADGAQVWVEDVLVERESTAAAETELAQRLAARMGGGLTIFAMAHTNHGRTDSPRRREAFEHFQRGRYEWQSLARHRMQDGMQHLYRATEIDPSFLPAQVDLVNVCITQSLCGFMPPTLAAEQVGRVARSIPGGLEGAEAILPAVGWVRFHADHDLSGALDAFAASAHLPHDPWTTRARVIFALGRHRFAEGIGLLEDALREDPYSPWLHARLSWALHMAGDTEAGIARAQRALELFPEHEGAAVYGGSILACNGQAERALKIAAALVKRSAYFDLASSVHAYALACAGREAEARAEMEHMEWLGRERFVMRTFNSAVWVALGEKERAIADLRHAETSRCPWFFLMLGDPRLKPLHGHPEFRRMRGMLARMEAEAGAPLPQ